MIPHVGQIYQWEKLSFLCVALYRPKYPEQDLITLNNRVLINCKELRIPVGAAFSQEGFQIANHQQIHSFREPLSDELLTSQNSFLRSLAKTEINKLTFSSEQLEKAFDNTIGKDYQKLTKIIEFAFNSSPLVCYEGFDLLKDSK